MNDTIYSLLATIGYITTIVGFGFGLCKLIDFYVFGTSQRNTRHKELVDKLNAIEKQLRNIADHK